MTDRLYQIALIGSTLGYSWLGMQIVHELGHILAAYTVGATVLKVVLHPLVISRTDVALGRYPLLIIWGGPVVGSSLPLVFLAVAKVLRSSLFYLFQFFAGFCLIANGVYLGAGSFGRVGDAGDLLRHGAPLWTLITFGLICTTAGLYLWNGLGMNFGLGRPKREVDRRAVRWAVSLLVLIVVVEAVCGRLLKPVRFSYQSIRTQPWA